MREGELLGHVISGSASDNDTYPPLSALHESSACGDGVEPPVTVEFSNYSSSYEDKTSAFKRRIFLYAKTLSMIFPWNYVLIFQFFFKSIYFCTQKTFYKPVSNSNIA